MSGYEAVPHELARATQAALRDASPANRQAVEDAWRDYRARLAETYIRGLVSASPPLTGAQRNHLAALLTQGATL